jgi:anti-anti-sigma regulatory factor
MLLELAPQWAVEIDRGPDWLFIRLRPPGDTQVGEFPLAETIWQRLDQAFCHRVVLELYEVPHLRSWLIGELVKLHKRVVATGGMMRLCGLSPQGEESLRACRLADRFPAYRNRTEAVMGHRPLQPR